MSTPPAPRELAVLLTVYHRVDPAHLAAALASLEQQTRPADEIVIVEDGPLTPAQTEVLDDFAQRQPAAGVPLRRIALPVNVGSGPASQAGLEQVTATWLARADADDLNLPERFAAQLAALHEAEERGEPIDVLGAALVEFVDDPQRPTGIRALPATDAELKRYVRINNPINNPTLMVRTAAVRAVGGYRDIRLMEDYDLMARLAAAGHRFANLPQPLVRFRATPQMFARRASRDAFTAEWAMQRNLRSYALISTPVMLRNVVARCAFRVLPTPLLTRVYRRIFHR